MEREIIEKVMKTLQSMSDFNRVEFVILYGSQATGEAWAESDIDLCVYYRAEEKKEMSRFRLRLLTKLSSDRYDVQIFQLLPLYIQVEVLKGEVLYAKDLDFLYEIALNAVRDYELFKPLLDDYLYR
ncbi:MAG: nucleotidyltransferase domain-containing protein [Candidatus Freyarchaeum deiterrae]